MKEDCSYQCEKCRRRWKGKAGPQVCPFCKHDYLRWINYDRWRQSRKRSKAYRKVYPLD